ncbi:helix-turn-helix transcriptional regulator [Bacillus alveayuensis]|jgi:AraC-like DNA-binding protein|uniref:helix-turn-helix transcriptional regulator n=1 Tax=Aeribacillus alveayuensis TaxID=279215 RepID=UPI0005CD08D0|nr:AraC family transcriptional regulator [Bacillus alveayuensis]
MSLLVFSVPPFPTFIKGGEATFVKGEKHFRRTFSVFDLLYVKKGKLYMTETNETFAIGEGEYIILLPEREHFGHQPCEEDTHFVWLHFPIDQGYQVVSDKEVSWADIFEREASFVEPSCYQFHLPQHGKLIQKEAAEQHLDMLVQLNDEQSLDYALKQQIVFHEFLLHLQKQALKIPSASEKVCEQVLKYIHHHYQEPIQMKDLSNYLHFHPDYITRCVQKTIGMSPMQYVAYYRLLKAKRLLSATNMKIAAVAKEVGIEDVTYFSRLFKKTEGMTPQEYRRNITRSK